MDTRKGVFFSDEYQEYLKSQFSYADSDPEYGHRLFNRTTLNDRDADVAGTKIDGVFCKINHVLSSIHVASIL